MSAHRSQAPAFQLEVRAPFFWRVTHGLAWSLAWLAGVAAVVAQIGTHLGEARGIASAVLLLLPLPLVGAWAGRAARGPGAQLLWDGRSFAWREGAAVDAAACDAERRAVQVQAVLDVGGFLLLRCHIASLDATSRGAVDRRGDTGGDTRRDTGGVTLLRGGALVQAGRRLSRLARQSRASSLSRATGPVFLPVLQSQHPGVWLRLRWALFSARRLPPGRA